jgi:hypothetical protein
MGYTKATMEKVPQNNVKIKVRNGLGPMGQDLPSYVANTWSNVASKWTESVRRTLPPQRHNHFCYGN